MRKQKSNNDGSAHAKFLHGARAGSNKNVENDHVEISGKKNDLVRDKKQRAS